MYPNVDFKNCVSCGQCEKVCPFINLYAEKKPLKVLAAKNPDEKIRMQSSSGGIFSMLAESVIYKKGVVFGVRFDENWQPVFDYTESMEGIANFRGSKYVQAVVGTAYFEVLQFLKQGRYVLFSGTPCQVAGLRRFLKIEYNNLLTVDVVCHGVPSPLVWRQYVKECIIRSDCRAYSVKNTALSNAKDISVITGISFRDKNLGWKKYSFVIRGKSANGEQNTVLLSDIHRNNPFMQAFRDNLILRPSCYNCKTRSGKSCSDVTIADFWGVGHYYPEMDDDKGTGLVLLNTEKGLKLYESLYPQPEQLEVDYQKALAGNPCIEKSEKRTKYREIFWYEYRNKNSISVVTPINRKIRPCFIKKVYLFLMYRIKRILVAIKVK